MASPPLPLDPGSGNTPGATLRWSEQPAIRVFITFVFGCALSIAVFPDAWASMMRVWLGSETFTHGFIVLPCAAWMLWRRREDWSALPQSLSWLGLVPLLFCGALWLAGRLGGVASFEQLGAVGVIPATVFLLVGPPVTRAIAFPLAFLFFAVPLGEFLTPMLMDRTADATVAALRWSGIPVYRDGLHFTLPTGRWSVVEACSGLRYLIASLALGVLYAYLQYRTLWRRLAFVALALAVPIVANWIRAYGIVLLGHLSDMRIATGVDHLIYGWLFFGVVMAVLFWIGSRWSEDPLPRPATTLEAARVQGANGPRAGRNTGARQRRVTGRRVLAGAVVAIIATALWRPLSATLLDATRPIDATGVLSAAIEVFPRADPLAFEPRYADAVTTVRSSRRIDDAPVELHAFYYARQNETSEMIHAGHTVVRADDSRWRVSNSATQSTPWGSVTAYHVRAGSGEQWLVWRWYAVGGIQTHSAYLGKAATAWSLATGRGDHSLAVVLVTPLRIGEAPTTSEAMAAAAQRLGRVATELQPAIRNVASGRGNPRAVPQTSASGAGFGEPGGTQ
jgi:exosortase A